MAALAAEFFTLDELNRRKIIQDVIDHNLFPGQAAGSVSRRVVAVGC